MLKTTLILGALLLGLVLGLAGSSYAPDFAQSSITIIEPIGGLWLNALQMTIVPLVVSLLFTGITAAADAARAGQIAARSVVTFLVLLWASSLLAAALMPVLFTAYPLGESAGAALRSGMAVADAAGPVPGFADFLKSLVPTNPIAAAANDAILPLIVFTAVFAFAATRLPVGQRKTLSDLFDSLGQAMLVVIGWVLAIAPIGVFALAYAVAVESGAAAFGALLHYVIVVSAVGIVVWLSAYVVAFVGGRVPVGAFARAVIPAQAVAISTQSSLASLPAMLRATKALGISEAKADIILPLAVALLRVTGPAMNLAVALYVAHLFGYQPTGWQLAAAIAVAATTTLGAVSLPGSISFVTSIAPIAIALGVPVAPLALLVAVETIPDIFRTVGNVTMDVAVTATVARSTPDVEVDEAEVAAA